MVMNISDTRTLIQNNDGSIFFIYLHMNIPIVQTRVVWTGGNFQFQLQIIIIDTPKYTSNDTHRCVWQEDNDAFAVPKNWENIYRSEYKLLSSFAVISDACRSSCRNKTTFTKCCLLSGFQVRQCLVNFMGLAGIVNATVYKTESIVTRHGHGKLS